MFIKVLKKLWTLQSVGYMHYAVLKDLNQALQAAGKASMENVHYT